MARVTGDWLVPVPKGWTAADCMSVGVAGYTAMLCVLALEEQGLGERRSEGFGRIAFFEAEELSAELAIVDAQKAHSAAASPEALLQATQALDEHGRQYVVQLLQRMLRSELDQRLAEAILARGQVGWFGLIGSRTKRAQFEHRLRARGVDSARIDAMACPIGLPGISGKEPAVIAIAVAAQLLMLWQANQPRTH